MSDSVLMLVLMFLSGGLGTVLGIAATLAFKRA